MPAMNLGDREAADLAHYLLGETRVSAPLEVTQFRGRIESLEDLDSAELFRTGPSTHVSLGPASATAAADDCCTTRPNTP